MSMFKRRDPSALQAQLEKMTAKGGFTKNDETVWTLTTDKNGNGQARIRFLPARDDDSTAFVKIFNHGFKVNGRWFIENCPTTLQGQCPVCKANSELYATEVEANKKIASGRKRKLNYYANVLVIKDPANPDNDGKVFKYRFGQKIMDKIQAMINVDEDMGETPTDVTCVFTGADFMLKAKKVSDFPNYDESKFFASSEIAGIDTPEVQKLLTDGVHVLEAINAPDQFKPFDELQTKFNQVIGNAGTPAAKAMDDFDKQLAAFDTPSEPARKEPVQQQAAQMMSAADDVPFDTGSSMSMDDDLDDLLAGL
ncbi:MAG: hypothetical protein ACRCWQ_14705 [Bacilli bacterium]